MKHSRILLLSILLIASSAFASDVFVPGGKISLATPIAAVGTDGGAVALNVDANGNLMIRISADQVVALPDGGFVVQGPQEVTGLSAGPVIVKNKTSITEHSGAIAVSTTATLMPAVPLTGRSTLTLQNLGPNPIYCRANVAVTVLDGQRVDANGGIYVSKDIDASLPVYCITTVLQVSPNDTRYQEFAS